MDLLREVAMFVILGVLIISAAPTQNEETGDGTMKSNMMFLQKMKAISSDSMPLERRRRFADLGNPEEMRRNSYTYSPQEFVRTIADDDSINVYDHFAELYINAFGPNPLYTTTYIDQQFKKLVREWELSRCKTPRMKLINLYDELNLAPNVVISPPAANVSRCSMNSGCCPTGEVCSHTGVHFKNKSITVLHIEGQNMTVKQYTVLEHHSCKCMRRPTPPPPEPTDCNSNNCAQKCPAPYEQNRETCQCYCAEGTENKSCARTMEGLKPLRTSAHKCVNSGECIIPTCDDGLTYNHATYFCA